MPGASVGDGGTAPALIHEADSGLGTNGKSHFFNLLGYELNDDDKKALCDEIMEGADFSKMKYSRSNEYDLLVEVPTKIYDMLKRRHIRINTIWLYDEKGQFNFVTAIPNILED